MMWTRICEGTHLMRRRRERLVLEVKVRVGRGMGLHTYLLMNDNERRLVGEPGDQGSVGVPLGGDPSL